MSMPAVRCRCRWVSEAKFDAAETSSRVTSCLVWKVQILQSPPDVRQLVTTAATAASRLCHPPCLDFESKRVQLRPPHIYRSRSHLFNLDHQTFPTMSGFDPNISNGTCYYDNSGNDAPSRYIPCGSSEDGHVPCCESQDNCLSSNACYNAQFGVTYLAGCTDKSYSDNSCPSKGDYSSKVFSQALLIRD